MNQFSGLISALAIALATPMALTMGRIAHAGELYEPANQSVTQATVAAGSKAFHSLDNQIGMAKTRRSTPNPTGRQAWLSVNDRQAIAQWIWRAERSESNARQLTFDSVRPILIRPAPE